MEPISKPRMLPSQRVKIHRVGRRDRRGPMVYIFADVLKELVLQARYRRDPCAALLIGGYYTGPAGLYIEIDGFDSATYLDNTRGALPLFQRHHPRLSDALSHGGSDRHVIGWSHGLPGSEGQLDAQAAMVHLSFFNLAWQTTFILDPDAGKLGVYRRSPDEPFENIGFNVISAVEVAHIAPSVEAVGSVESCDEPDAGADPAAVEVDGLVDFEDCVGVDALAGADLQPEGGELLDAAVEAVPEPVSVAERPSDVQEAAPAPVSAAERSPERHVPANKSEDILAAEAAEVWQDELSGFFEGVGAGDSKESFGLELDSAWHDAVDDTNLQDFMEGWSAAPGAEAPLKDHDEPGSAPEGSPEEQPHSPVKEHAEESGE